MPPGEWCSLSIGRITEWREINALWGLRGGAEREGDWHPPADGAPDQSPAGQNDKLTNPAAE